jgi:hypothetical protein
MSSGPDGRLGRRPEHRSLVGPRPERLGHSPATGIACLHIGRDSRDSLPGLWDDDLLGPDDRGPSPRSDPGESRRLDAVSRSRLVGPMARLGDMDSEPSTPRSVGTLCDERIGCIDGHRLGPVGLELGDD